MASISESGIGRFVVSSKPSKMWNNSNSFVHKINWRLHLSFSAHFPFRFQFPPFLWPVLLIPHVAKFTFILYIHINPSNVVNNFQNRKNKLARSSMNQDQMYIAYQLLFVHSNMKSWWRWWWEVWVRSIGLMIYPSLFFKEREGR